MVGGTNSSTGDVSGNHGDNDYWVVKLGGSPASGLTSMYTVKDGSWTDGATWSGNREPKSTDVLRLNHAVNLPNGYSGQALDLFTVPQAD